MKLRAGYLGLKADYEDETGREAARRVAELWNSKDEKSEELYDSVLRGLVELSTAVEEDGRRSELGGAVGGATRAVMRMRETGEPPGEKDWRELRAVLAGALPMPTRGEIRRIKERAGEETDHAGKGGRETEGASAWSRAVRRVGRACQGGARGLLRSASEWRRRNEEATHGDEEEGEWDLLEETTEMGETDVEVDEEDIGALAPEGGEEFGLDGRSGRLILVGAGCGGGGDTSPQKTPNPPPPQPTI